MSYRILVVDDFELWRRHIRAALQPHPRWEIVGEAGDGPEAVEKARTLQPDLILLDVSLPTVDGIEAAPRILAVHPHGRILFLSEHRSPDIVEAAFAAKACGYLLKSEAGRELLSAMQAIMDGKQFISATLAQDDRAKAASDPRRQQRADHVATFYSAESSLVDDYARFAASALEAGNALILVVNAARREQIHGQLRLRGIDVEGAIQNGRYFPLDPTDVVSSFMVDGRFDEARCAESIKSLVTKAARAVGQHRCVAACGDGAATLWTQGLLDACFCAEQLWDDIARTHNVDVLCGYLLPSDDERSATLQKIQATHSRVHSR